MRTYKYEVGALVRTLGGQYGIVRERFISGLGNAYQISVDNTLLTHSFTEGALEPAEERPHEPKPVAAADPPVGLKYDGDKVSLALLSPTALLKIGAVMDYGARKYADHNWRKGIQWSRVLSACLRHTFAYIGGQDNDPETGLSHLAHAACCLMFLLEYEETHRELDNRYRASGPKDAA